MSVTPDTEQHRAAPTAAHDRLLITLAVIALAISVAMAIAGEVLHIVVPLVLVLVIVALGFSLRIVLRLRARRSAALSNQRVLNVVSWAGLGLSVFAAVVQLIAVLPLTTLGKVVEDSLLHLVTIAILLVLTSPARTVGWRTLLGIGLASFLGVSALARAVGTPVAAVVGVYSDFFSSIYAPFTEEVLKALPILLVLLPALRNGRRRPTAVDFALVGLASGTGYAIIENASFGRVLSGAVTPLVVIYPTMTHGTPFLQGVILNVAGHAVWTAFIGLGLGFGLLYRRRFRFAWVAIPATFLTALLEHCVINAGDPPAFLETLIANGNATPILLTLGVIAFTIIEAGVLHPLELLRHPRELLQLGREGIYLRRGTVDTRMTLAATRELGGTRVEKAER
jgi:RsiW-degrading membrane proteinase PrsW (M82 family)